MYLTDATGVTGVSLKVDDVLVTELENEGGPYWDAEPEYMNVPAIVAALDGTWTIEIAGSSPSETEFTLDIGALTDGDLWPTPTIVTPASGATGVANDVVIEWTNPAGTATVDAILVEVSDENEVSFQEDDTIFGEMTVADTQWNPPLDLLDGPSEFGIIYLDLDDAARASSYTVNSGDIVWGDSPYVPEGYPSATPLLAFGSERIVAFTVGSGTPCPADLDGSGSVDFQDLLAILVSWGPCEGCPADLDGDGVVGFSDLLAILFAWGSCS